MTTRLVLNHWQDWLVPGNPGDSRLFHSDTSDRILVCPDRLGRGYIQEILLRDDLTLLIHDYTLHRDVAIEALGESNLLAFDFQLASPKAGYSFFFPYFGFKEYIVKRARQRFFKVKVCFKQPTLITYFQTYMERLSPQTRGIAERVIQSMYRYQGGGSISTTTGMLNRIVQGAIASHSHLTFEHILTDALYSETIVLNYANRSPIIPAMEQAIGQILSCPYRGATRRAYLERQALELVSLHLRAMEQPCLSEADLNCIYQAASILRNQLVNPPTVEALSRQVCTNRLKLNQGFREVYGTTPFGYLRDCRLRQAHRLLMTSDLSIGNVAVAVGYTCRSKFAMAFRQQMGINPKAYQMQAWQCAS
jgi:AraC-like DNA-binding protein